MTMSQASALPSSGSQRGFDAFIRMRAIALDQARASRPLVPVAPDGDDNFLRQSRVDALAAKVLTNRIQIIHGRQNAPIAGLMRRVAAEIASRAASSAQPAGLYPTVALLDSTCGLRALRQILADEPQPLVIVAEAATRRLSGWDLDELRATVLQYDHYLLMTSSAPQAEWQLSSAEKRYWHDDQAIDLYDPGALTSLVLAELNQAQGRIDDAILAQLVADAPALVASLESPLRIRIFGRDLRDRPPATLARAQELQRDVAALSMPAAVNRWFHTQLDQRARLIACGLCFFDGFWEETAFFYLDQLLEQVWGLPSASTLDRVDLENLESFFAFTASNPPHQAIRGRYAGQRRLIFGEALPQLRRHARQALYDAAELLRDTLVPGDAGRGAYGLERSELRRALSTGFAALGPVDRQVADDALLLLVADGRSALRDFVATVLGRWYATPADRQRFFDTVAAWRGQLDSELFVQTLFDRGQIPDPAPPADCINAVLLSACAFAASADRPEKLSSALRDLIVELSASPGERTRRALREVVIAQILGAQIVPAARRQPQQIPPNPWLTDWLNDLCRAEPLRRAVAAELAACSNDDSTADEQIAAMIRSWIALAAGGSALEPALIAAADLNTLLNRDGPPPQTRVANTLHDLSRMRLPPSSAAAADLSPDLLWAVESALLHAGVHDPQAWDALLSRAAEADLARYVQLLRLAHIDARRRISSGDAQLALYGETFWVSLSSPPPLTPSKRFVEYLLANGGSDAIFRLALCAELAMAQDFDLHEEALIQQRPGAGEGPATPPPPPPMTPPRRERFWVSLLPEIVGQPPSGLTPQLKALAPLVAAMPASDPALTYVLDRSWPSGSRSTAAALAPRLAKARKLAHVGPIGLDPGDFPRAAGAVVASLRDQGVLALAAVLTVLVAALLFFLLVFLVNTLVF